MTLRLALPMPARLRPTATVAADAILVGDPGRALMLAQELLEQPKMSNHARGLWGYTGRTAAGAELTVQATGMGGPSAAIVLADLAELGVRRAIRVGTCAALDPTWRRRAAGDRRGARPGGTAASASEPARRCSPTRSCRDCCGRARGRRPGRHGRQPRRAHGRRAGGGLGEALPPTCSRRRCSPAAAGWGGPASVLIVSETSRGKRLR